MTGPAERTVVVDQSDPNWGRIDRLRFGGPSPLAQAIAELKAEVRQVGLTDAEIDADLAAYNAERAA